MKTKIYYEFKDDKLQKCTNLDVSTYIEPCRPSTSKWWSALSVFNIPGVNSIKEWFNVISSNISDEDITTLTTSPYTAKICPAINDLFKRSYLVKWPSDIILTLKTTNNYVSWVWKAADDLGVSIAGHSDEQYKTSSHNIYNDCVNIKICLPLLLGSNKKLRCVFQPAAYHLSSIDYHIMPHILTYNEKMHIELNINTMFKKPPEGQSETYMFKSGTPICYLTHFDEKDILLEQKKVRAARFSFISEYKRNINV